MGLATHDTILLACVGIPIILIWVLVAVTTAISRVHKDSLPRPRWFAAGAAKRWGEQFFILYSGFWVTWFGAVVVSGVWEHFRRVEYMVVCTAMAAPCVLLPLWLQPAAEAGVPFWSRYWVKANIWIAIISFVGNYFWTHYFYTLLGASYTFDSWRINDVPIPMFLATHAYFCTYHSLTSIMLRRWWTGHTYARMPQWLRSPATCALVCLMAWVTALTEALTIQNFPYYAIRDRTFFYTVGSIVYGIYFIVSFPMFFRLDEDASDEAVAASATTGAVTINDVAVSPEPLRRRRGRSASKASISQRDAVASARFGRVVVASTVVRRWSVERTAIDSLGACMLVTIMLDLFRISYLAAKSTPSTGIPWMPIITT